MVLKSEAVAGVWTIDKISNLWAEKNKKNCELGFELLVKMEQDRNGCALPCTTSLVVAGSKQYRNDQLWKTSIESHVEKHIYTYTHAYSTVHTYIHTYIHKWTSCMAFKLWNTVELVIGPRSLLLFQEFPSIRQTERQTYSKFENNDQKNINFNLSLCPELLDG